MKLQQNQIWQRGDQYLRIVHLERMSVDYKLMKDPIARSGTHHRSTKKEFCRLIKGATLLPEKLPAPQQQPVETSIEEGED